MADTYFGMRKVKDSGIAVNGQVWVEYEDGGREIMHKGEWEACKSEVANQEGFEFDKDRVMPVTKEILASLYKHNVRLEDLSIIFRVVIDSLQLAVDQAKELSFGSPQQTLRVDDVQKIIDEAKEAGKEPSVVVLRAVQGALVRL